MLVSASLTHDVPTHAQQDGTSGSPAALLSTPAGIWAFADGQYLSTNMSTRGEIMSFILSNPGVYLREISEDLGLSMGVVQYHVWVLTKNGEIEDCRSGRYRRFFGAARYQDVERTILSLLRQGTAGRILTLLSVGGPLDHKKLAAMLGVTSQALSWHTKRLRAMGILETSFHPTGRLYTLVDGISELVRASVGFTPNLPPIMDTS